MTILVLVFSAGIVHKEFSKSNSDHLATRISPVLTPVSRMIFRAARIWKEVPCSRYREIAIGFYFIEG